MPESSPVPSNYELSELAASYMRKQFLHLTQPNSLQPDCLSQLLLEATVGMNKLVGKMAKAFEHPGEATLPSFAFNVLILHAVPCGIDAIRLSESLSAMVSGNKEEQEARLLKRHPPASDGVILEFLAVIVGKGNTIVLWYLPGALSPGLQVSTELSSIISFN